MLEAPKKVPLYVKINKLLNESSKNSGFYFAKDFLFHSNKPPPIQILFKELGSHVVLKSINGGSSLGLVFVEKNQHTQLPPLEEGEWLAESYIAGREYSIGFLNNAVLETVEIQFQGTLF